MLNIDTNIADFNSTNSLVEKARLFALVAHSADRTYGPTGQKRKYSGEPYIIHPIHVCTILQRLSANFPESVVTAEMQAAAILHDVVEDTGITIELVEQEFGLEVSRIVAGLTDVSKPEDGNRAARKALDLSHTAEQASDVKTVKLADLISNAPSIISNDKGFAVRWMSEKEALLEVLADGDRVLHSIASDILRNFLMRNDA